MQQTGHESLVAGVADGCREKAGCRRGGDRVLPEVDQIQPLGTKGVEGADRDQHSLHVGETEYADGVGNRADAAAEAEERGVGNTQDLRRDRRIVNDYPLDCPGVAGRILQDAQRLHDHRRQRRHLVYVDRPEAGQRFGRQLVAVEAIVRLEEPGGQSGMDELKGVDRLRQVAQAEHADIVQAAAAGQGAANQRFGCRAEQGLAAVRHRQQAGDAIERATEIVAAAEVRRPAVQRDAHAQRAARRPLLAGEARLDLAGGPQRCRGVVESDAEGVADRLEDESTVALDRRREQRVVPLQRDAHRLRLAFPEACRPFDVGKQEGGVDQCGIAEAGRAEFHLPHGLLPVRLLRAAGGWAGGCRSGTVRGGRSPGRTGSAQPVPG
ncbi:MAG: hypothetical protein AW07_03928 [Candidatus Accumulibacter sp. SK-11]|nr:MAG: hypothetical protein AW07_03928 [Candidatus Accumulibacter sp. SK-11]